MRDIEIRQEIITLDDTPRVGLDQDYASYELNPTSNELPFTRMATCDQRLQVNSSESATTSQNSNENHETINLDDSSTNSGNQETPLETDTNQLPVNEPAQDTDNVTENDSQTHQETQEIITLDDSPMDDISNEDIDIIDAKKNEDFDTFDGTMDFHTIESGISSLTATENWFNDLDNDYFMEFDGFVRR